MCQTLPVAVPVPGSFGDITATWVSAALREGGATDAVVTSVEVEPLGEGVGFLGDLARLRLSHDPQVTAAHRPDRLIAKLPTTDPGGRAVGETLNVWPREAAFFADVAPQVPQCVPTCWYNGAEVYSGRFTLLLDDVGPIPVDQVAGATPAQAEAALDVLARFHARWWQRQAFAWMPGMDDPGAEHLQVAMTAALPAFAQRYGSTVPPETVRWLAAFVEGLGPWRTRQGAKPLTIVHADYRLDNVLFAPDGAVKIVDWQTALRGPAALDVASFVCNSLTVEDRRAHEARLLAHYRHALAQAGVDIAESTLETDYREAILFWMGIYAMNLSRIDPTDARGTALFQAMIDRTYTAAADHRVGELL